MSQADLCFFFFFFFKQKTAYEMRISDWSSDVCSSDLALQRRDRRIRIDLRRAAAELIDVGRRTDDGDAFHTAGIERQRVAVILQQRERLLLDRLGGVGVRGLVDPFVVVRIRGTVENAEREPGAQHGADVTNEERK